MADKKIYAVAENKELSRICYTVPVLLDKNSWLNEGGIYKQTVSAEGIKADDMPILFKSTLPNISKNDFDDYGADYGLISGGQCAEGQITFYAADTLNQNITVLLGMGNKGDGRLLLCGGGSGEKTEYSNVIITILDSAAVAEGGTVTATCNKKSWESTIRNGKARLYTSEVGNYIIRAVATDGTDYTTMLTCPYFGSFSTDIYSGSLEVTCTDAGGVGKTCQVRSCDDDYNFTNDYDLTQTFDDKLMLPFPGISAGKYLITVDGKYVFFKEIQSIQYINSVNVQLRQWLYNRGDECPWNTGGWMKCKVEESGEITGSRGEISIGKASIDFSSDKIIYNCAVSATPAFNAMAGNYLRQPFTAIATFGTRKSLLKDISLYKKIKIVDNTKGIMVAFRTGSVNDETTQINTAIVLQSMTASAEDILVGNDHPYLVLGNYCVGILVNTTESINVTHSCKISEIWLE